VRFCCLGGSRVAELAMGAADDASERLQFVPRFAPKTVPAGRISIVKVQNEKTFLALPGRMPLLAIFWGVALGG
jgi:hypothetical protein